MDIEKKIKDLQKQVAVLKKQKELVTKKILIEKLEKKICNAKARNYNIRVIYVSSQIYYNLQSFWDYLAPAFTMIHQPPIKYNGYKVYCNYDLKPEEIHIAI